MDGVAGARAARVGDARAARVADRAARQVAARSALGPADAAASEPRPAGGETDGPDADRFASDRHDFDLAAGQDPGGRDSGGQDSGGQDSGGQDSGGQDSGGQGQPPSRAGRSDAGEPGAAKPIGDPADEPAADVAADPSGAGGPDRPAPAETTLAGVLDGLLGGAGAAEPGGGNKIADIAAQARQTARRLLSGRLAATARSACGYDEAAQQHERLDAEQRTNAEKIVAVARDLGLPPRAAVIALATARQESWLRNLDWGDRDSVGLFQQRPSAGWGDPSELQDPVYAATAFYRALAGVEGWQSMPLTVAAQAVQRSAFGDRYARWERMAARLVAGFDPQVDPADLSCRSD